MERLGAIAGLQRRITSHLLGVLSSVTVYARLADLVSEDDALKTYNSPELC